MWQVTMVTTVYTQGQEFLTFKGFLVSNKLGAEKGIRKMPFLCQVWNSSNTDDVVANFGTLHEKRLNLIVEYFLLHLGAFWWVTWCLQNMLFCYPFFYSQSFLFSDFVNFIWNNKALRLKAAYLIFETTI